VGRSGLFAGHGERQISVRGGEAPFRLRCDVLTGNLVSAGESGTEGGEANASGTISIAGDVIGCQRQATGLMEHKIRIRTLLAEWRMMR